jgi:hypothetical protein
MTTRPNSSILRTIPVALNDMPSLCERGFTASPYSYCFPAMPFYSARNHGKRRALLSIDGECAMAMEKES